MHQNIHFSPTYIPQHKTPDQKIEKKKKTQYVLQEESRRDKSTAKGLATSVEGNSLDKIYSDDLKKWKMDKVDPTKEDKKIPNNPWQSNLAKIPS